MTLGRPRRTNPAVEWVIVGGGIHGVHLGARLIGEAGVPVDELLIVDPGPTLLHTWRRGSTNTGMRHLRSPAVHHLDLDPWSLHRFAEALKSELPESSPNLFSPPYDRPSRSLFAAHSAHVIQRYGLGGQHIQDAVVRIDPTFEQVEVRLESGEQLIAGHVLLALGATDQIRWPPWARTLRDRGARVDHVFDPGFVLEPEGVPRRVAVIGAGLSGAQVALRLAGTHEVHLVSRHGLRKHQFDSDPGWVGPKNMNRFLATPDLDERRRMITAARHVGSVPPDVHRALRQALGRNDVHWHQHTVDDAAFDEAIRLQVGPRRLSVDAVILATGFGPGRPGGKLIDTLVSAHGLPCATCGYPVVDTYLRWHPRILVTGPLAELEIGPASRNIAGARRAAERIVRVAKAT